MRIIGKKDYWDSALAYGQDDDLVVVRKREVLEGFPIRHPAAKVWLGVENKGYRNSRYFSDYDYNTHHNAKDVVVVFPDEMYVGMLVPLYDKASLVATRWEYLWSDAHAKRLFGPSVEYRVSPTGRRFYDDSSVPYYPGPHKVPDEVKEWMVNNRVPYVVGIEDNQSKMEWQHTGILVDVDFQKVLKPMEVYQKIYTWVSNMGDPGRNMVQIADEYKIAKHGFDRFSFRTPKKVARKA